MSMGAKILYSISAWTLYAHKISNFKRNSCGKCSELFLITLNDCRNIYQFYALIVLRISKKPKGWRTKIYHRCIFVKPAILRYFFTFHSHNHSTRLHCQWAQEQTMCRGASPKIRLGENYCGSRNVSTKGKLTEGSTLQPHLTAE
jgi:hypothetical protein